MIKPQYKYNYEQEKWIHIGYKTSRLATYEWARDYDSTHYVDWSKAKRGAVLTEYKEI